MTVSTHASWNLRDGDEIAPGLTAVRLLGGGSSYEAYLAFDELRYCPVVVKVVRPDQVEDASTLRGLRREVEMLEELNHPAIVRGFHAVLAGPRPLLVLEALDGPRLSTLVRRHGPLQLAQALPLAIELCSAAHYLHARGVVHLDIKPSNIIMGAPARLIDLSVARTVASAALLEVAVGTDDYMAPEQCDPRGAHRVGPPADMWGIGATLFHAIAGYRAFERPVGGEDVPERRWPQLVSAPDLLPAFVPTEVAELVLACLQPDPADRPTPVELAERVAPLMEALPKARLSGFKVTL